MTLITGNLKDRFEEARKALGAAIEADPSFLDARVTAAYIARNPVEAGLCARPDEWKWSSYRHYALRERLPVEIESEWTARDREAKITGQKRKFLPPPPE